MKTNTLFDQLSTLETVPCNTAALLAPLFTWRGKAVYPVFGAEGDDDPDADPDSDPDDKGEGEGGNTGEGEGSGTVSREDFDKLKTQLSMADKNKAAAERKLKEIEDSKKDELTKATERAKELEDVNTKQAKEIADLRLQNAFLGSNTGITWHDPADALALAERQGYLAEVVNDEGAVDAGKLTAALKALAKAKPHLVKDGSTTKEDKDKDKAGPTGSKVGGNGKAGKDEPNMDRYSRHFNR